VPITEKQRGVLDGLPKNLDRWMCRHEWHYSQRDIQRWQSDAHADAKLIRLVRDRKLTASRNGSACFPQNAMPCAYRDLCVQQLSDPYEGSKLVKVDMSNEARLARLQNR